jgi:hypothetical protein
MTARNIRGRLPHPEADFEDLRCRAPEHLIKIERAIAVGNPELREKLLAGALLRRREASLAQDVAPDRRGRARHGARLADPGFGVKGSTLNPEL